MREDQDGGLISKKFKIIFCKFHWTGKVGLRVNLAKGGGFFAKWSKNARDRTAEARPRRGMLWCQWMNRVFDCKDNSLNLHIDYPIILLLKIKITPKSKSKLYNYNKILKCININSKLIFLSLLVYYLYYYLYKNTNHNVCITIYSCIREEIRIPIFMLFT